jgi:hypothetical protein
MIGCADSPCPAFSPSQPDTAQGDVRLFGSRAKGRERPDSDVDLLVRMAPGRDLLDLIELRDELERTVGLRFDVVTEAALSPYMRERVLREALALR